MSKKRQKKYMFDKYWLECPTCGRKMVVKSARNMSWVACTVCGYNGKHLFNPKEAVAWFLKEFPLKKHDYEPARLAGDDPEKVDAGSKEESAEDTEANKKALSDLGDILNQFTMPNN